MTHPLARWIGSAVVAGAALLSTLPAAAQTGVPDAALRFASIDGGTIDLAAHDGPVLVVNTASLCAFTPQYDGLQALHESHAARGLMVLAVPSDDFAQELASGEEVKAFCDVNFGLTLPMTEITRVRGPEAHPFYGWLARTEGWSPRWNFHKVLLKDGRVLATFGSSDRPQGGAVRGAVEAALE